MKDEVVRIKGTANGLSLLFAAGADFAAIEAELKDKIEKNPSFFLRGTVLHALAGSLPPEEMEKLRVLFRDYGLIFTITRPQEKKARRKKQSEKAAAVPEEADRTAAPEAQKNDEHLEQMVVVNHTLRGGQEVRTKSSVLVLGNVNPGAQIIAGGSIDIRGTCRGVVHAGAYGSREAFIIADRLIPTQIRIADLIARSPDGVPVPEEKPAHPERAAIKDGQIVIEPIERQENR